MLQATHDVSISGLFFPPGELRLTRRARRTIDPLLTSIFDVRHHHLVSDASRDAALAHGVSERDRASLEEVFRTHGASIKSVAYKVLRNEEMAEDVVQETLLSFWKAPGGFDPDRGSLRTYLLTIAHRRAVDIVRSEAARTRRETAPPDPQRYDLEDLVVSKTTSERVRRAVLDLRPEERDAIAMAYFGGFSYRQVAERLEQPEGTVKSRIRAGMMKLATSLEALEQ